MPADQGRRRGALEQFGWLILIWSASVGTLALAAAAMRLLMEAAGLGA